MLGYPKNLPGCAVEPNTQQLTVSGALLGLIALAFAISLFTPQQAMPVIDRAPAAIVDADFATLRASPFNNARLVEQPVHDDCSDFSFAFIHAKCLNISRKHISAKHVAANRRYIVAAKMHAAMMTNGS